MTIDKIVLYEQNNSISVVPMSSKTGSWTVIPFWLSTARDKILQVNAISKFKQSDNMYLILSLLLAFAEVNSYLVAGEISRFHMARANESSWKRGDDEPCDVQFGGKFITTEHFPLFLERKKKVKYLGKSSLLNSTTEISLFRF